MSEVIPFCRVCNALEPVTVCLTCGATATAACAPAKHITQRGDWLAAIPTGLAGEQLGAALSQWCSDECKRADPSFKEFESGADMLDTVQRFGSAPGVGVDLVGAMARSRGVSREEAARILEEGFDKGLKEMKRPRRGRGRRGKDGY